MMALMPIMFGGMFIVFPVASGLALYIRHYGSRCCGGPAAVSKPKDADARPREGAQEEKLNCLHRRVSNSNAARFSQSVK